MPVETLIKEGDCLDVLQSQPSSSIDLMITSPPYADSRQSTYGGIHPDRYVEWFLPRAEQFLRVLKPTGSFVLNITKEKKFKMNQDAVMIPMGDWAGSRLKSLGKNDVVRFDSKVGSGFGKNIANWVRRSMAYPTNVLHLATECGNRKHSAAFPPALPEWFIRVFTDLGDWILDPFAGSGTALKA